MKIVRTRHGLRLSQHGVVISELRTSAGPTHSVFDLLAALTIVLAPAGRIGLLGFAGGGMMGPLRALGMDARMDAVDLDRGGYDLFRKHCPEWSRSVNWKQADAAAWLRRQRADFDLLIEDLSVPANGDVFKPDISWNILPGLIHARLRRNGVAVFNLMLSRGDNWKAALPKITKHFGAARLIKLDEFENRILIVGASIPTARELGTAVRRALRRLRSRQAAHLSVHSLD